jgi:radical SAM superfamily enzyme YgiQ (UPF0313 family)
MGALSRPARRKVYLVQPRFPPSYWGQEHFLKLTRYGAAYPPLGLLTLAALTPPEFEVVLCDEAAGEPVDFTTDADLVGITGYLFQLVRVFEIADRFRALGKTVVLGGPAANLLPAECRPHCDVLFEGEAEYTWPRFLRDYAAGRHADRYHEPEKIHLPDSPPPRLDVLTREYGQGIVQCTRGCPFTCEFCDIIVMYGRKMRFKPVERVIQELEAWQARGVGTVFFADDNFVGNRAYAKELLRGMADWNARQRRAPLSFHTQASADMVRDEELLALFRDANFTSVFLGIETPRKASLREARKGQNEKLDLVQAVHKIQSYNLFVSAGMIVGFDHDDAGIFDEQYDFLQEAGIPIAMVNALEAVPGTPLYHRLEAEGRLLNPSYTNEAAASRYRTGVGGTNLRPARMTPEELQEGLEWLFRELYAPEAFAARLMSNLSRFRDVRFRPEAYRPGYAAVFFRLLRYYWGKGPKAGALFWSCLWKALRRTPRVVPPVFIHLGMYMHFCELHQHAHTWDPWARWRPGPRRLRPRGRPRSPS